MSCPLQDAHALGEIILSSSANSSVFVDNNVPPKLQDYMFVFMLHNSRRARGGFPLMAESAESMKTWMTVLNEAINMTIEGSDPSIVSSDYEDDNELYASVDEVLPSLK